MIQLTNRLIREALARQGYGTAAPGRLHLVGIRSAERLGPDTITRHAPRFNRFDDVIAVFGTHLEAFQGTVDPGRTWTLRPSRPEGCAHLCDGGPYRYVRGLHRRKPGLLQADRVLLWRDRDWDGEQDPAEIARWESGNGINGHRMGQLPTVDAWSAGCWGMPESEWRRFWPLVEAAWEPGQREFLLWVVDGSKLLGR